MENIIVAFGFETAARVQMENNFDTMLSKILIPFTNEIADDAPNPIPLPELSADDCQKKHQDIVEQHANLLNDVFKLPNKWRIFETDHALYFVSIHEIDKMYGFVEATHKKRLGAGGFGEVRLYELTLDAGIAESFVEAAIKSLYIEKSTSHTSLCDIVNREALRDIGYSTHEQIWKQSLLTWAGKSQRHLYLLNLVVTCYETCKHESDETSINVTSFNSDAESGDELSLIDSLKLTSIVTFCGGFFEHLGTYQNVHHDEIHIDGVVESAFGYYGDEFKNVAIEKLSLHNQVTMDSQKLHDRLQQISMDSPDDTFLNINFPKAVWFHIPLDEKGCNISANILYNYSTHTLNDAINAVSGNKHKSTWQRLTILGIVSELAIQLAYLHDLGLCHRDVKPANILVGGTNLLKIIESKKTLLVAVFQVFLLS